MASNVLEFSSGI